MDELLNLSALSLAELVRRREVSSEELTRLYLDRIETHDPALSAFTELLPRRALASARAKDRALRQKRSAALPVFHGVPCGIKDLTPMRGTFTRFGSRAFRYFISPVDASTARLVRAGGFVVLGKLATSEFGALPVTEPAIHPPTRNPWRLGHTPGGSSGGSGAAVAAGLLPIAQGSDGGGSIRIPAAFCHLYGFKPSRGLLGNLHGATNVFGLSVMGPLSRTVEDAAAMLDVLRGCPQVEALAAANTCLGHARSELPRVKVRFCTETPICDTLPEVRRAVEQAARLLSEHGCEVGPIAPPDGSAAEFLPIWQRQIAVVPAISERLLQPMTRWLRAGGREVSLEAGLALRDDLSRRVTEHFADADLVITPTVPVLPPSVGAYEGMSPPDIFEAISSIGAFTAIFNVTGQPAASIPVGFVDGLPIGIQLAGRPGGDTARGRAPLGQCGDGLVLTVSRWLEQAMPWDTARPAAFA